MSTTPCSSADRHAVLDLIAIARSALLDRQLVAVINLADTRCGRREADSFQVQCWERDVELAETLLPVADAALTERHQPDDT
jgi:uncharacterized membrane-anchored protein